MPKPQPSPAEYADVDLTHKPSEMLDALRQEILLRLERRRGLKFDEVDKTLMMFDEIVASSQRALKRGRDN